MVGRAQLSSRPHVYDNRTHGMNYAGAYSSPHSQSETRSNAIPTSLECLFQGNSNAAVSHPYPYTRRTPMPTLVHPQLANYPNYARFENTKLMPMRPMDPYGVLERAPTPDPEIVGGPKVSYTNDSTAELLGDGRALGMKRSRMSSTTTVGIKRHGKPVPFKRRLTLVWKKVSSKMRRSPMGGERLSWFQIVSTTPASVKTNKRTAPSHNNSWKRKRTGRRGLDSITRNSKLDKMWGSLDGVNLHERGGRA